jgi:hypothetical protein
LGEGKFEAILRPPSVPGLALSTATRPGSAGGAAHPKPAFFRSLLERPAPEGGFILIALSARLKACPDTNRASAYVNLPTLTSKSTTLDGAPIELEMTLTSCYTSFVSSANRLRNVTVTLEEDVARWARVEAARRDTSVSRLLGELLKERMSAQEGYARAMRRALGRKPFLHGGGSYLTREEVHDRARLR